MVPPSEHSLDVAEPCLPSSQVCGSKTVSQKNRPGQRKGEGSEMDTRLQGDVGPGGDTLEVEDNGGVTH